jgi:hypothetical protein
MEGRIRALRPHRHTFDRGDDHWRPGIIASVAGETVTIRVWCCPGTIRDFDIAAALLSGAASIGAPLAARMSGNGALSFTVAEVRAGQWGSDGPGADEAGAVARGDFHLAIIPREITGESDEYAWTAQGA